MKFVAADRHIAAPPTEVWALLTDSEALMRPGTGIERIEGEIADGANFTLTIPDHSRPFRLTVTKFEPDRCMVWSGGLPLGLFRGVRTFTLSPTSEGSHLQIREVFTGPLLAFIWRSMPDLQPSFDGFVAAIAAQAEEGNS